MTVLALTFVFNAATHRILVETARWRKWQIIIYKLVLTVAAGLYIIWGTRYIFPGINWTEGEEPEIDNAIKEFIILYIIGSADFVVKLYEKVCDLDKTADLKYDENPLHCSEIIILNPDPTINPI